MAEGETVLTMRSCAGMPQQGAAALGVYTYYTFGVDALDADVTITLTPYSGSLEWWSALVASMLSVCADASCYAFFSGDPDLYMIAENTTNPGALPTASCVARSHVCVSWCCA